MTRDTRRPARNLLRSVIVIAVCGFVGCVKQQTTMKPPPPQPNPQPKIASDVGERVQTLEKLADGYARLAAQLPGPNVGAHRKLMAEAFSRLGEILPMLEGPNPNAEFRQQLDVIGDAHAQLATGPASLSPEPTIDTGLRAMREVLTSIAHIDFYDSPDLTTRFDQLTAKINDLDTASGPLHQVQVAEAVSISAQIITTMSQALDQRLASQDSTTAPASRPSSRPSPPATHPVVPKDRR